MIDDGYNVPGMGTECVYVKCRCWSRPRQIRPNYIALFSCNFSELISTQCCGYLETSPLIFTGK